MDEHEDLFDPNEVTVLAAVDWLRVSVGNLGAVPMLGMRSVSASREAAPARSAVTSG